MPSESLPHCYNLERQLSSQATESGAAYLLNSVWILDKQALTSRLLTTSPMFDTYSDHGPSHSQNILLAIERILCDRIKLLGPTDTWMLLESAYRHDTGMQITQDEIDNFVKSDDFPRFLEELQRGSDEDLRRTADVLLHPRNGSDTLTPGQYTMQIIKNNHMLQHALSQYYRNRHGDKAAEIMSSEEKHPAQSKEIPSRLWRIIGKICKGHTEEKEDTINSLPQFETGIAGDDVHPRFLQILLRLGDLLDLDNNRFNPQLLALWGSAQPRMSRLHQLKHEALHHLYICPESIEVISKFYPFEVIRNNKVEKITHHGNDTQDLAVEFEIKAAEYATLVSDMNETEVIESVKQSPIISDSRFDEIEQQEQRYRDLENLEHDACVVCGKWLTYLKDELEYFALNWLSIIPSGFPGSVPRYSMPEIWWQDQKLDISLLMLKYTISHQRAASIIQGTGLYGNIRQEVNDYRSHKFFNAELFFIRELVQNAMDATKIQVSRYIKEGRYGDPTLNFGRNPYLWNPIVVLKSIGDGLEHLGVEVRIYYNAKEDSDYRLRLEVIDVGTGIDAETLQNMSRIGDTRNQALSGEITQMPEWLRPSGSFGIGMQSVFGIVNEFRAKSGSRIDHVIRDLFFRNMHTGGDLFAMDRVRNPKYSEFYGTTIIVDLNNAAVQKILPKTSSHSINEIQGCEAIFNEMSTQLHQMLGNDIFPIRVRYYVNQVEVKKRAYSLPSIFSGLLSHSVRDRHKAEPSQDAEESGDEEPHPEAERPRGTKTPDNVNIRFRPVGEEALLLQVYDAETRVLLMMYLGDRNENAGSASENGTDERFVNSSASYPINLYYRGLPVPQVELLNQMPFPGWRINAYVYRGDAQDTVGISRNQLLPGVGKQLYPILYNAADQALTRLWKLLEKEHVNGKLDEKLNLFSPSQKNALAISLLYHRFFSYAGVSQQNDDMCKYAELQQYFFDHSDCAVTALTNSSGFSETSFKSLRGFMQEGFERCWFIAPDQMPLGSRAMKFLDDENLIPDEIIMPQDIFSELAAKRGIPLHASRVSSIRFVGVEYPFQYHDDSQMNPNEPLLFPLIFQFGGTRQSTPEISETLICIWRERIIAFAKNNLTPFQRPILPGIGRFASVCLPRLPDNLYQDSMRSIGSYFVCPFTYQQIHDILLALQTISARTAEKSFDQETADDGMRQTDPYQIMITGIIDKLKNDQSFKVLTTYAYEQLSTGNHKISAEQVKDSFLKAAEEFIAWLRESNLSGQADTMN